MLARIGFTIRFFLLVLVFLAVALPSWSQGVPRNLNYQAVARDDNGYPIVDRNIVVEITIRANSETGEIVWQETHYKKTNEFGLFNLLIGSGVSTSLGTSVAHFSDINWAKDSYFIQTRVDFGAEQFGNGLMNMGTAKLSSVPYALLADSVMKLPPIKMSLGQLTDVDLTGLQKNKVLRWSGQKWVVDDAISGNFLTADGATDLTGDWTISNNNITLMSGALTSTTVRTLNLQLLASPSITQFSTDTTMGGTSPAHSIVSTQKAVKTYIDNFLSKSDWIRDGNYLYNLNNNIGIGVKNPSQKFEAAISNSCFSVSGSWDGLSIPNTGAGTRMFFSGGKAAFRAGRIDNSRSTWWDGSNVGNYSTAMGYNLLASGDYSSAFGYENQAVGAMSSAFGTGNITNAQSSFAAGSSNSCDKDFTIALGFSNKSSGVAALTVGMNNLAKANASVSMGYGNISQGNYSLASGSWTQANGDASLSSGSFTQASGNNSVAMGERTVAMSKGAFAMGRASNAGGDYSAAFGNGTSANSFCEFVIGQYNKLVVVGSTHNWVSTDRIFTIGNGTALVPSDAMVVLKSGRVGLGVSAPTVQLDVNGDVKAVTVTQTSDIRFKKDISTIDNALDKALHLRGVYYNWRVDEFADKKFSKDHQLGFLAQEVERVLPELVFTDSNGYKSVDYARLTAVLVEAIKEQQKIIAELKIKVKDGENKIDKLNEQFAALNQRMEVIESLMKASASSK